ncbi:MAG TPA: hypothetical protein DCY59_10265 [Micrococcaceae bacterium]|jgi:hypothetical protein|nr:hypothetical protein [Micrococcaceae bacterium]
MPAEDNKPRLVQIKDFYVVLDKDNTPLSQKYTMSELPVVLEKAAISARIIEKLGKPSNPAIDALLEYRKLNKKHAPV